MGNKAPRQVLDWRTRLLITLLSAVMIFVLNVVSRTIELHHRALDAQQAQAQKQAKRAEENAEALAAAESLHHQTPDTTGFQFSPTDDLEEHLVGNKLSFSTPADWHEQVKNGSFLLFMASGDGKTLFKVGIEYDLCSTCTSCEEAIAAISRLEDLEEYHLDTSGEEHGQMGDAHWYRFPINDMANDNFSVHYGYLEIVLSGRDAYWVKVFRNVRTYTDETRGEMLSVLNTVGGVTEEPLFGNAG